MTSKQLNVVLGGAVVVLLVIVGFLALGNHPQSAAPSNPQVPAGSQDTANPTPPPDLTATWKTYTNAEYGFEFKYPENLSADEAKGSTQFEKRFTNVSIDTTANLQLNKAADGTEGVPILFEAAGDEPKTDPDISCGQGSISSTITVAGISASKCVGDSLFGPGSLSISFSKDQVVYYHIISDKYVGSDVQTIDQIISTFKFTN